MNQLQQQTLALAGVAQSAFLVNQLAMHGMVAQDKFATAIHSIFALNPQSTVEVFKSVKDLKLGLETLQDYLGNLDMILSPSETLRYVLGILHLEAQLQGHSDMAGQIRRDLERLMQRHAQQVYLEDNQALKDLSRVYRNTLSTLPFRIHVRGDLNYLRNELVADKVRILLLAGVRSAFLWRQLGGRRWQLLIKRGQLRRCAAELVRHC